MKCPHCLTAETTIAQVRSSATNELVREYEACPDCQWWTSPARVPTDPYLLARTAGFGITTGVP